MVLADLVALLEETLGRLEGPVAGGLEAAVEARRGQLLRVVAGELFTVVEVPPLGAQRLDLGDHGIRVQARLGDPLGFLAQVLSDLVVGPMLPVPQLMQASAGRMQAGLEPGRIDRWMIADQVEQVIHRLLGLGG